MGLIRNKLLYEKEKLRSRINAASVHWMRQPIIIGMDETIAAIRDRRASIARFGDGEFDIIFGRTEGFQKKDDALASRLREILLKNILSERFLVALPDCFGSLEQFTEKAQFHWRIRLDKERIKWVRCLNMSAPYYQAQITRFYFDWADKSNCSRWYEGLKSIWNQQNVLIVEGTLSRVGVGNDLFDNAKSVRRILCPAENAFSKYDDILKSIQKYGKKDDLILMALGPTATVLAYDLFLQGFWAFDAGHLDLEYEWMRKGTTEKTAIPGKYVNEVAGGNEVVDCHDNRYQREILLVIN